MPASAQQGGPRRDLCLYLEIPGNSRVGVCGERQDEDFSIFPNITLDSYTLLNLYASYDVYKNATLFGRVEKLFDEHYEEVLGYGTPGRAEYGGLKVTF